MASQISPPRDDNSTPTPIATNDHNRPISVLSTASYSPTFIPAPRSPTRSLATEVLNTQPYQRPETGTSVHTEHTFNSSYPPSIDDEGPQNTEVSRLSFVSGESEEYARTPSPMPPKVSPAQPHHARSNTIERHISKPTAVSDSLGFSSGSRGFLKKAMTRSARSPGASTASKIESIRDIDSGSDYQRASVLIDDDVVSSKHETWPLRTPTGSPTPPKKDIQGLEPLQPKSPFIVSDVATKSSSIPDPQPLTSQSSIRSPKASRFNLIPKFLRSTSAKEEPHVVPAKSPKSSPNDPVSFFDDGVSDEDTDEDPGEVEDYGYDIQDARPAMVVRSGSNTIELKEMLRSTPPISDRLGPSRVEAGSRLRTHIDSGTEEPTKKEGIYQGLPQAEKGEDPNPQPGSGKSGHHGLGAWKDINPFAMSVLRSHQSLLRNDVSPPPPTPPKSAPAGRKVSFPTPAPLDIKPEHRFLRQSIVSTPYPTAGDDGKHRKGKKSTSGPAHKIEHDNQANAVLTLVLYGNSSPIPKIKTIAMPSPQETQLISETENGKPPIMATHTLLFDDEALSKLLRSTYNTMRGPLRYLASARKVRNIRLLSYTSIAQLASRHAKPTQFRGDNVMVGEEISEKRLLDLFQKPRLGRRRHEWTNWIKELPENGKGSEDPGGNKIAVEFVEGWAPGKLYCAVAAVLFCSLLAMFLYIFAGSGGQVGLQIADSSSDVDLKELGNGLLGAVEPQVQGSPVVYKGPRGRVQTGVELGILVLMIGWTAVGGWTLLSWLVI